MPNIGFKASLIGFVSTVHSSFCFADVNLYILIPFVLFQVKSILLVLVRALSSTLYDKRRRENRREKISILVNLNSQKKKKKGRKTE